MVRFVKYNVACASKDWLCCKIFMLGHTGSGNSSSARLIFRDWHRAIKKIRLNKPFPEQVPSGAIHLGSEASIALSITPSSSMKYSISRFP